MREKSGFRRSAVGRRKALRVIAPLALGLIGLLMPGPAAVRGEVGSAAKSPASDDPGGRAGKVVRDGIAVEFDTEPVAGRKEGPAVLMEGDDVTVRFKITDTTTGTALTGLRPAAWMDPQERDRATARTCHDKIQSFLQASFNARPEVDLNTYYVLVLNREPNISVIDPLRGFGTTKLYTLVLLKSPGEDWALSRDKKRLFVTMPEAHQVAVVDTITWKVVANVDAGARPVRLALQPDGKYLWVGNDAIAGAEAESGVTVIDTDALKSVARIRTGAGHHEIAFTGDDRYTFVTNRDGGTLSVVDIQKLAKAKDVATGPLPAALAFSALGQAVYVADETEGTVVVIDGRSHEVLTRIKAQPGLTAIRFVPDGRWGFVINSKESVVHVIDASTNRVLQTADVEKRPDQVSFTRDFAYIRSAGSEQVSMIPLRDLGQGGKLSVSKFPGGQTPPERSSPPGIADVIVAAPEAGAVLVANPADKIIYYYTEGMAAPQGSFQNYRREPRGVLVLDRSLREAVPGVYSTTVKLPARGKYDVAFLLDSPRVVHCFEVSVRANPALPERNKPVALQLEPLLTENTVRVGERFRLRFKLTDTATGRPKAGLKDVRVLAMLAPAIWQQREWAQSVGDGIYEVAFTVPEPGVYYVFFECPSLRVRLNQLPPLILHAVREGAAPAAASAKKGEGLP